MNLFGIFNTIYIWIIAGVLLIHDLRHWRDPHKQDVKYSEIIQVVLFFFVGYYLNSIFFSTTPENIQNRYYGIMFGIFTALVVFFLFLNVFPNYLKYRNQPEIRKERSYDPFLQSLQQSYKDDAIAEKKDKFKDFSRKTLHFIQYTAIIFLHVWAFGHADLLNQYGFQPLEFRNYLYLIFAAFFWIMMGVGDLTRIEAFEYLPQWARWWYSKSLEPEREAWTFNSAITILLANMIFIHPDVPVQVFFIATLSSCLGDAMASIIGKNFGKHKLKFGKYPKKSIEGMLGGGVTVLVGSIIILLVFPIGISLGEILLISSCTGISFMYIDVYVNKVSDNLVNSLLPGFITWGFLAALI